MNTILYDQQLSTLAVPDGLVIDVMTPTTGNLQPAAINEVDFTGTSNWGQMNAVQIIATPQDIMSKLGSPQVTNNDLPTFAKLALSAGVQTVKTVRVGSGTQVAAVLPLMGASAAFTNLSGLYPGSLINGAKATFTWSPNVPIANQVTSANPSSTATVDLTITIPGRTGEVFQNLACMIPDTVNVGKFKVDQVTLDASIRAAVNNGQANGRGPSQYFVASTAATNATAGIPVIGTANAVSTNGTDGLDFGGANTTLDAAMLGSNTVSPPTGMQAFAGQCSGGVLCLIGDSNVSTIASGLLTFAKAQNAHAVVAFPDGTPRTGASSSVDLKGQYALLDWSLDVFHGEWCEIIDADNGAIHRFVDPAACAAIRIAITSVPRSPANLALPFVIGTSKIRSDGTVRVPWGSGDALAAENAGVNYWTNDTSGNVGFAVAHNKNSLGKTAGYKGNIAYGRNLQFAIATFNSPQLGKLVGGTQGFASSTDSSRKAARGLFNGIIGDWIRNGIFDGTAPQVVCDLSNNSPGKGMLRVDVYLQQREIIDNVAVGLTSGVGPLIAVNPPATS